MFTIKKATTNDIQLINEMAQIVFPATYREILSKEQLDYMMDWMYSPKNLRKLFISIFCQLQQIFFYGQSIDTIFVHFVFVR